MSSVSWDGTIKDTFDMLLVFTCVDLFANGTSDVFTEMPNLILIDAKFFTTELKELKIFFKILFKK